jgi:CelD/BcsL family acetyltransferase involved in cellulose biosynthesis
MNRERRENLPPDSLDVEEIVSIADLQSIAEPWGIMAREDFHATPFQSPEWLIPWWKHVGEGQLFTLAIRADHRLVGLLPMYIYMHPETHQRRLLLLGSGTSDYLGGTFEAEYRKPAVAAAFAHISRSMEKWDVADFFQLRCDSDLLAHALKRDPQTVRNSDSCMTLDLPSRGALPAKIRTNMRNYRRKAEGRGTLQLVLASVDNLAGGFNHLLKFQSQRWEEKGISGVLTPRSVQQHHREALPLLHREGYLRLYTLLLGTDVIAVLYALVDPTDRPQRTLYFYLMGFDPSATEFGPGTLMYDLVINACHGEGIQRFDMLRGEENYKRLWGASAQKTFGFTFNTELRRQAPEEAKL